MGAPAEVMVVAALRTELLFVPGPKAALGVGAKALDRLRTVLARSHPKAVAILGYAGGLRADLRPGTLVLADLALDREGAVRVSGELLSRAKKLLPRARIGPVYTDEKLTSLSEKAGLEGKAIAVDMETSHLARELSARGIPFLVGRVVLDAHWEEAPRGFPSVLWAGRALRCAWVLGQAARALRVVLAEAT